MAGGVRALKQIFPEREPVDIPRTHPLFHCVFDIPNELSLKRQTFARPSPTRTMG